MLTGEEAMDIRVLWRQGMSIREIGRRTGRSRNTVRAYIRSAVFEPTYKPRQTKPSILNPFKPYLVDRVRAAHPIRLPATVLFREIQDRGYEGQLTIVRDFLRSLKPEPVVDPVVRFETEPGEQMQVDWCQVRRGKNRLTAFVATMGYSRASYVQFATNEDLDTLLQCLEGAFTFFGGVPRHLLFDNMKTVVLERDAYGLGEHRFQPTFRMFATHYGFLPRLCRPYRAKTKGKVERFNHYLQGSFYHPLRTRLAQSGVSLDAQTANVEVGKWLRDVANVRVHGTTGRIPADVLQEELPQLQVLPPPWCQTPIAKPAEILRFTNMKGSLQPPLDVYEDLVALAS